MYFDSSSVNVTSCIFTNCRGTDSGGAILSMDNNYLTIEASAFTGCSALNYAGAVLSDTDGTTHATITSSAFTNCSANIYGGAFYANSSLSTIKYCRIYNCNTGTAVVMENGTLDAENNWWGTNSNPSGYTTAISGGPVDVTPWLVLSATASPSLITTGAGSSVEGDLTYNSAGEDTSSGGHIPDKTPATFSITGGQGSLSSLLGVTASGKAAITYSSSSPGTATISTTVDGQAAEVSVTTTDASSGSGGGANTNTGVGVAEELAAGKSVSVYMDKGAVYRVLLTAGTYIEKLMITVKSVNSVPSSISEPGADVYEYEDLTLYFADDSGLSGRTFYFRVQNVWFTSNGYAKDDIAVLAYNKETGSWDELETKYDGEKNSYKYYISESPDITWLAIAYMKDATIVPAEKTHPTVTKAPKGVSPAVTAATPKTETIMNDDSSEEASSGPSLILPVAAVFLTLLVIAGRTNRKRHEKYPDWWDHKRK